LLLYSSALASRLTEVSVGFQQAAMSLCTLSALREDPTSGSVTVTESSATTCGGLPASATTWVASPPPYMAASTPLYPDGVQAGALVGQGVTAASASSTVKAAESPSVPKPLIVYGTAMPLPIG
jgi:hypothetical protein